MGFPSWRGQGVQQAGYNFKCWLELIYEEERKEEEKCSSVSLYKVRLDMHCSGSKVRAKSMCYIFIQKFNSQLKNLDRKKIINPMLTAILKEYTRFKPNKYTLFYKVHRSKCLLSAKATLIII